MFHGSAKFYVCGADASVYSWCQVRDSGRGLFLFSQLDIFLRLFFFNLLLGIFKFNAYGISINLLIFKPCREHTLCQLAPNSEVPPSLMQICTVHTRYSHKGKSGINYANVTLQPCVCGWAQTTQLAPRFPTYSVLYTSVCRIYTHKILIGFEPLAHSAH
jgi:hypothetical protein